MGIIKLKNANEEQTKNIAIDEQSVYGVDVEVNENTDIPQENQEQWQDPAVLYEDESRTDEHTRHYVMNNGTAKSVFNAESVSYFDEDVKKWKPIDNSLKENADAYESKNGNMRTKIYKANKGKKVEIAKSDKQLSWEYLGKQVETVSVANENIETFSASVLKVNNDLAGESANINSSAVYENIEKDTDLEYCLLGNNLKENIIVREKSADYRYLFALKTEGLKIRLSEDNESLELYTERTKDDGTVEQKVEFTIPAPFMYDANGESSDDVYYELEPSEDGKFTFAVVANEEWVNAADRVFPVTIDPQVVTNNSSLVTKQVQYRIVSSGSGSGSSVGSWTNTSYSDIKVYKDDYIEYRTRLTIKRSSMNLPNNRICSVKLILTPSTTFSGSLYVNNYYHSYNSNKGKLEQDITNVFKSYIGDFDIYVEPYYYGYINGYFSMSANPPVIEIEYLTNENTRATKKSILLAGFINGEINLATGDMTTSFCDVKSGNSAGGISIYHVYKKSSEDYLLGDSFRLNIHEKLIKNSSGGLEANYIYTDPNGDKHGFNDYYYYINTSGGKEYINNSNKSNIMVDADGTLKYNGYTVYGEYKSASGLKALTKLEGFKYVSHLEQRSDELKKVDEKVNSYGNALKEFVVVNKSDGSIAYRLKSYLSSVSSFESFVSYANSSTKILLTEGEALVYRSLILQKEALGYQSTTLSQQKTGLGYSKISMQKQIETMDNTKLSDEAYNSTSTQSTINTAIKNNLTNQILLATSQDANTANIATNNTKQITAIGNQITIYDNKKTLYLNQMKTYYNVYYAALDEQKKLQQQIPVNFLTDGKIFKGFNEAGQLVVIYDMYNNYAIIEYESYYVDSSSGYRIASVYDNFNNIVTFAYTGNNKLASITDVQGRKTCYEYTGTKLTAIKYDIGEKLILGYTNNNITSVVEQKKKLWTNIAYSLNRPTYIKNYLIKDISKEVNINNAVELEILAISFLQKTNLTMNHVTLTNDKIRERYYFDDINNLCEYRLEKDGVVTQAEQYEYISYWNGTTMQTNPRSVTRKAKKSSLFTNSLDGYNFVVGDTETTTIDQFENALQTTTSEIQLTATGSNKQTTVIDYAYNENQKLIEEKITTTCTKLDKPIISYKKYNYNAYGDVIRTESYVDGEEYTTGKTIEETVYDDKGNVIKSFTYNSLDTSSKFYTETKYDEKGRVAFEFDATGNNKAQLLYADGANIVREEVLPNGSKFAYGHDYADSVTAISHSTEEGEENSTQQIYQNGVLTEVCSGNNRILYSFDYTNGFKKRKESIAFNGVNGYVEKEYNVVCDETCLREYDEVKVANAKKESVAVRSDKRGNIISKSLSDGTSLEYSYDTADRLTSIVEKGNNVSIRSLGYSYDALDRLLEYTETTGSIVTQKETFAYDDFGRVLTQIQNTGMTYSYEYNENTARRELKSISVSGIKFKPQLDCLGRHKGKEILVNDTKIAEENIVYRKVGDHTTHMPASIYFGSVKNDNFVLSEHLKYAYDEMGNISKVYENGDIVAQYAYDKLNRLIREDNKRFGKTWLYSYDNNGNLLVKKETSFTLKTDIEENTFTINRYAYVGDQLKGYNDELFVYDEIGNPITYRGKDASWARGRLLTAFDGHSFTYDAQGRRLTKDGISFTYDGNGRIVKQSNGLDFFYDNTGVAGVKYNNETFVYRKNVQGDVVAILDTTGKTVVKYTYDAWGNHAEEVLDSARATLAALNPFRYRSYYYDTDTELYYLNTRYYDPELGRFITIDGIEYLNPETINGLNLYAYCGNNPVSNVDPNGNDFWSWFLGGLSLVGGVILCFVPGGQAIGAALIVGGVSITASNIMTAAGVDSKIASLISSGLDIVAGIALCFVPGMQGLGASLIGSGALGIAGGYISEALGGSFELGAAIGSIIGGFIGGKAYKMYDAHKIGKIAQQGTVVIGETMSRVHAQADLIGAGTFKASKGANLLYKIFPKLGSALTMSENMTWIRRVIASGVDIVDIGIDLTRANRSIFYSMELQHVFKFLLMM